jgi:hypothetical protein
MIIDKVGTRIFVYTRSALSTCDDFPVLVSLSSKRLKKKKIFQTKNCAVFNKFLDLLQLIARGHCRSSTVRECCLALCKESTPVLQPSQFLNQEKLAILEGIVLQHANQ